MDSHGKLCVLTYVTDSNFCIVVGFIFVMFVWVDTEVKSDSAASSGLVYQSYVSLVRGNFVVWVFKEIWGKIVMFVVEKKRAASLISTDEASIFFWKVVILWYV